jgi:trans-aconitate methyltransferase
VVAKLFTNLVKKQVLFVWTKEHSEAFNALNEALVIVLMLAMPDFLKHSTSKLMLPIYELVLCC